MTIGAGSLRHRISIERRSTTQDANTGQRATTWSLVANRRANIQPIRSQEKDGAGGKFAMSDAKITIRYDSSLNLTEQDRITNLQTGKVFEINGVVNMREENRVLELFVSRESRDD